jgi:tetratricopeptide (TPR) repeat protein
MTKRLSPLVASALLIATMSVASSDYAAGVSSYRKQNYKECIRHLKAYTETTPDPRAYYLMGYARYKLKDFAEAREYFMKAYLIDPAFKPASIELWK